MRARRVSWLQSLSAAILVGMLLATFAVLRISAASSSGPKVELDAKAAQPREVEDTTEAAIARDYSAAWKALATALSENRTDALDAGFTGIARDNFAKAIEDQKKTGLRRRYTDRGHKLQAVFYSPEGSAMQLHDIAQYDVEILDGNSVIHREQVTEPYVVLMTVAEGSWKVRVLESLPK